MSVDEYTREFEKLLIKCDIQEPEEQTIVRYLGGLEPKYSNVVELQQYSTFDEVCVLAHKVEQKKRRNPQDENFPNPRLELHLFTRGVRTYPQGAQPCSREVQTTHILPFLKEPQLLKKPILPLTVVTQAQWT